MGFGLAIDFAAEFGFDFAVDFCGDFAGVFPEVLLTFAFDPDDDAFFVAPKVSPPSNSTADRMRIALLVIEDFAIEHYPRDRLAVGENVGVNFADATGGGQRNQVG